MKHTIKISLIAFLTIASLRAASQIKPISVGDKTPDFTVKHLLNESKSLKYSNFKGKALIIDFWATWCSPCIKSLPHIDSLQTIFRKDLQIICVTNENSKLASEVISRLFNNKKPSFKVGTADSLLSQYWPHRSVPHYVWIDKFGTVIGITEKDEVNFKNIKKFIGGQEMDFNPIQEYKQYDPHKPPFASKSVEVGDELLYHSMIGHYRKDLHGVWARGVKNDFVACTNTPILILYQLALGKFDMTFLDMNRVIFEGFNHTDSVKVSYPASEKIDKEWQDNIEKYAYTYEIYTKDSIFSADQLFSTMHEDLNRYFQTQGISGQLENKMRKVIALTFLEGFDKDILIQPSSSTKKYSTPNYINFQNQPINIFLNDLAGKMKSLPGPFVNKTGYNGKISLELDTKVMSIDALNKQLAKYGLKFEAKEESISMVVIKKK